MYRRILGSLLVGSVIVAGCADDAGPSIAVSTTTVDAVPVTGIVAIRASGCRSVSTRSVGIVVAPGLVATVAHAVAGEERIELWTDDGATVPASVVAIDTQLDAAVLRAPSLVLDPVPVGSHVDDASVELVTMPERSPRTAVVSVRRRVLVRTTDIYGNGSTERPGFELADAAVEPGDSGGGLFEDGSLVGIVWAASREDDQRAWATDIAAYAPLLARAVASRSPAGPDVACAR